jgi:hypothetical protein
LLTILINKKKNGKKNGYTGLFISQMVDRIMAKVFDKFHNAIWQRTRVVGCGGCPAALLPCFATRIYL